MKLISIHYSDGRYSYMDESECSPEKNEMDANYLTEIPDEMFELWEAINKANSLINKQLAYLDEEMYLKREKKAVVSPPNEVDDDDEVPLL